MTMWSAINFRILSISIISTSPSVTGIAAGALGCGVVAGCTAGADVFCAI